MRIGFHPIRNRQAGKKCKTNDEQIPRLEWGKCVGMSSWKSFNYMKQTRLIRIETKRIRCTLIRFWPIQSITQSRRVETAWNRRVHFKDKNLFPMSSGASEWAVRANEWADERMAQYSTRRFHIISTHSAVAVLALFNQLIMHLVARLSYFSHHVTMAF